MSIHLEKTDFSCFRQNLAELLLKYPVASTAETQVHYRCTISRPDSQFLEFLFLSSPIFPFPPTSHHQLSTCFLLTTSPFFGRMDIPYDDEDLPYDSLLPQGPPSQGRGRGDVTVHSPSNHPAVGPPLQVCFLLLTLHQGESSPRGQSREQRIVDRGDCDHVDAGISHRIHIELDTLELTYTQAYFATWHRTLRRLSCRKATMKRV